MEKEMEKDVRPWGNFVVFGSFISPDGTQVVIKKITVNPGARLSLQSHQKRAENWVRVAGRGLAEVDGREVILKEGQSVFVPVGIKHRLTNTSSKEELVIIEVATGDFDESDIERFVDDYGRLD